jgi:uncharacterized repeat protein (TIGR02543 family)
MVDLSKTITYNGNGNTGGTVPTDSNTYLAGATVTLAIQGDLERTGYTFSGWNTAADGNGTDYTGGAGLILGDSSITLYAKWEATLDIKLTELTITRPSDTSLRTFTGCAITLMNYSPANVSAKPVLVEFYLSANTSIGDADDVKIGEVHHSMTVLSMDSLQYTYDTQYLNDMGELWTIESVQDGSYYLLGRASFDDGTAEPSPDDNALMTTSTFSYTGTPQESGVGMRVLSAEATDLSTFNESFKYSIVYALSGIAAQGSSSNPTSYPFTLATTSLPGLGSLLFEPRSMVFAEAPEYSVYDAEKIHADAVLRAQEERLLKSGLPQLNNAVLEEGVSRAAPAPIEVGTTWNDVKIIVPTVTTIETTCIYVSDHAYFFIDNRDIETMRALLPTYAAAFDDMYDVMHDKFGTENDVDGNGKIIIVFTSAIANPILGYFFSGDKYEKLQVPDSNESDIFYLGTTASPGVACGVLAHEFQHMIYFDQHYNRNVKSTYTWLNEALSQAAEYVTGYTDNHLKWIKSFLVGGWQGLSLTYWTSSNYGYGAIFMRYLIDQFGDTMIKDMCSTASVGIAAVEAATEESFDSIFTNFTRALVIDGTGDSPDTAYGFWTLELSDLQPSGRGGLLPKQELAVGESGLETVRPYGISFTTWTGSFGTMSLTGAGVVGTAFGASQ